MERTMSSEQRVAIADMGARLSTLWVVVMFNMVFADILTFIRPGALQELWTGQAGVQVTPGLLLGFAILLEVPIAMIFLSRTLKRGPNRWANTVAAVVTTAFVVGGGSLTPHYVFFASVEIACMALIVWSVWTRRSSEAASPGAPRWAENTADASGVAP
jgi:Sec-independent protein secretion pathway component TatC